MNITNNSTARPSQCSMCSVSYGFNDTNRRSIIIMVVLTAVALLACYIGVLWFAFRKRSLRGDKAPLVPEDVYRNSAFNKNELQYEYTEENLTTVNNGSTAAEPAVFVIEGEQERF